MSSWLDGFVVGWFAALLLPLVPRAITAWRRNRVYPMRQGVRREEVWVPDDGLDKKGPPGQG